MAQSNLKTGKPEAPGLGVKMLCAGSAASIADLMTFPLDTAKVRLQVRIYGFWGMGRIGKGAFFEKEKKRE